MQSKNGKVKFSIRDDSGRVRKVTIPAPEEMSGLDELRDLVAESAEKYDVKITSRVPGTEILTADGKGVKDERNITGAALVELCPVLEPSTVPAQ